MTERPPAVLLACGFSFCVVLAFIFVRAPHPWGWEGFDHYRDLGLALAHGQPYPTLERLWGYPYFLAACYRLFGERQWIPLVIQALLNALIPLLLYVDVRRRIDERTAVLAAALAAVLSFNNIYASTQSSDALCTVLFVATIVAFGRAQQSGATRLFALSGALAGLALLLRPNMLLLPVALLLADLLIRKRLVIGQALVFVAAVLVCWTPWVVRNYRLSDRIIPATTHGGIQLWIGTLQAGRYFENWFDNPRAIFESTPFDYSLPSRSPWLVTAQPTPLAETNPLSVSLVYWTDRDRHPVSLAPAGEREPYLEFFVPPLPPPTVIYYYFDARWPAKDGGEAMQFTPAEGPASPFIRFVGTDHLGDLDVHGDLLDIFDVVRLLRHEAWHEAVANADALDLDGDGRLTATDLDLAAGQLVSPAGSVRVPAPMRGTVKAIQVGPDAATLVLKDDSTLAVPKAFSGRVTDLAMEGRMAGELYRSRRPFASLRPSPEALQRLDRFELQQQLSTSFDGPFYRTEPRQQDRYVSMAFVNLRETPLPFVAASLTRILRLFVVIGSTDAFRARQFRFSQYIYWAATLASLTYLGVFLAGAVVAVRRRLDVTLPLVAIAFVPATIFPLFGDMRFTVTAQPFIFVFIAISVLALADARGKRLSTR